MTVYDGELPQPICVKQLIQYASFSFLVKHFVAFSVILQMKMLGK